MSKIRVAFIGLGMAVDPHAKSALDLAARMEVAFAYSPSVARRNAFAERYAFPLCDDLETILRDESIDAVAVLTPPSTHLEIVRRCAAAKKHVLLEKPLEITTPRAEALVACCGDAGVKLGVVLQHRHKPAVERLIEIVKAGELGTLFSASATVRLFRPQSYYDEPGRGTRARDGGGVLLTQGIHTLDVLLCLAGEPERVFALATTTPVHRMECEDLACATVQWKSGALGVIEATTAAYPGFAERIEITGVLGTATLLGAGLEIAWSDGRPSNASADTDGGNRPRHVAEGLPHGATASGGGGTGANPMAFSHEFHRGVWTSFLDAIENGGKPRATGEEALRVHRLIDAILASAQTGGSAR